MKRSAVQALVVVCLWCVSGVAAAVPALEPAGLAALTLAQGKGEKRALKNPGGVQEAPNGKAKAVTTVNTGDVVTLTGKKQGAWVEVEAPGGTGWVPAKALGPAPVNPPKAKLASVSGKVTVKKAAGGTAPGTAGMDLEQRDAVMTGADSSADVRLLDGRDAIVYEQSEVTVDVLQWAQPKKQEAGGITSMLGLVKGKVRSFIAKALSRDEKYEIKTATAVTGVRGTDYRTTIEAAGSSRVEVTQSTVQFAIGKKSAPLKENFGNRAKAGDEAPGQPHPLPPPPMSSAPQAGVKLDRYRFTWEAQKDAKAYHIEIAADREFMQVLDSATVANGTAYEPASKTLPLGTLFWHVSTIDGDDYEGKFGESRNFTVTP